MPKKAQNIEHNTITKQQVTRDFFRDGINAVTGNFNATGKVKQFKESILVDVLATTNLTLTSLPATIDGVALFDGMVFLAIAQTTTIDIDVYMVSGTTASLLSNWNNGNFYTITNGTYANRLYELIQPIGSSRGTVDNNFVLINEDANVGATFDYITTGSGAIAVTNATGFTNIFTLNAVSGINYHVTIKLFIEVLDPTGCLLNTNFSGTATGQVIGNITYNEGNSTGFVQPSLMVPDLTINQLVNNTSGASTQLGHIHTFDLIIEATSTGTFVLQYDTGGSSVLGFLVQEYSNINITQ